jgi:Na+-driven multidrug efflux pump
VAISYVLIFGALGAPALGTMGAGVGTTISVGLGTAYYVLLARTHARDAGFLAGLPDRTVLAGVLRLSVPTGLQQLTFSAGFTALFWIIGRIGEGDAAATNVAAANVLINIMLFAVLPGMGLGLAANSLVGHALGRGDAADARRWGWDVVKVGVALMACLGVPMVLAPDLLLSVFLHNPETRELARLPLRVVGLTIGVDAVGLVLQQALLGAGDSRTVLVVSAGLQWGFFLPAAFVIGPTLGFGLLGIWVLQVLYRAMQAGIFAALWQRGRWATIAV